MATTYVVLRRMDAPEGSQTATFELLNEGVEALTAGKACDIAADDMPSGHLDKGVDLVAVPARSWKYVTIREETTRRRVRG